MAPTRPNTRRTRLWLILRLLVAALSVEAIAVGLWHLAGVERGLDITTTHVGDTPVTVFRPPGAAAAPVVVIAHGFAGSQQLMLPFATTLARHGYLAVTFDFPGHGRNPEAMLGGLKNNEQRGHTLTESLGGVVAYARTLAGGDGRIALLGHSMGAGIVVDYAIAHPEIAATIAVSPFAPGITATAPRNLLVIVGALEPGLTDEAFRVVALANGGKPVTQRTTYGNFADGTARRVSLSGSVEHIGVLFSAQSMNEARAWLDAAFSHHGDGTIDHRGPWLGVLYLGLVALAWPLSALLPVVTQSPAGAGLRWRRLLPAALVPAILTPLILWKLPTDFLPILLGDYLVVHFAVYGVLTFVMLWVFPTRGEETPIQWGALLLGVVAVAAYSIAAIGLPIDRFITSFVPIAVRQPLVLAMLCGTVPYFCADEWLTRGSDAPTLAYGFTKLCFVISLAIAIALNLQRLFFLIIIIPVILIFFVVYGLFSGWTFRRTRHPLVGGLANALAFAWAIAVTFPVIG